MTKTEINRLLKLPRNEKIELVQLLWNKIAEGRQQKAIPQWHKNILDQTLHSISNGTTAFKTWDEVKKKYESIS